ncbi:programmed cell death 4, partial [Trifolium medium]|nr:programmed cell death 4 [Trifolium medium]
GSGGKGTWGGLLDTDGGNSLDPNDPNYDSTECRVRVCVCTS